DLTGADRRAAARAAATPDRLAENTDRSISKSDDRRGVLHLDVAAVSTGSGKTADRNRNLLARLHLAARIVLQKREAAAVAAVATTAANALRIDAIGAMGGGDDVAGVADG